jgi:hypothetical protein
LTLAEEFVSIFYHLMGSANQIDVIALSELVDNVFSESKTDSTVVFTPFYYFFVGVTPEQIAE